MARDCTCPKGRKKRSRAALPRALKVSPPFDGFYFIDLNKDKTDYLRKQCEGRSDVQIYTGDCNAHLTNEVFPKIRYDIYTRALCLLNADSLSKPPIITR